MRNMTIKITLLIFSLLLIISVISAQDYTGHSLYRLIFIRDFNRPFNPNQDLLIPDKQEQTYVQVRNVMISSVMKSMLPLTIIFKGNATSDNDLFVKLLTSVSILRQSLIKDISKLNIEHPLDFEVRLIPWTSTPPSIGEEKITLFSDSLTNILGLSLNTPPFDAYVLEETKKLQSMLFHQENGPAFLLGMNTKIQILKDADSRATIKILLCIRPSEYPFKQSNNKVDFKTLVVPDKLANGINAELTIDLNLTNVDETPTLLVQFGELQDIKQGIYSLDQQKKKGIFPFLEGTVKKVGPFKDVSTKFLFPLMKLDLETLKVSKLDTLIVPTLNVLGAQFVVKGFRIESVNQEFSNEINKILEEELQKVQKNHAPDILDGLMSKEIILKSFLKILGQETK